MKKIFLAMICIAAAVASKAQLSIGTKAPEISLPDTRDSIISLSSFKGKVVLIDFWASWCRPCRAANPSVVKLYRKYKDKGLVILAVSIDSKKQQWLNAIRQDKLNYVMLNDNAGWNSKTAEQYIVNEIPSNFLVDKEGKIVAVNEEGMQLDKKIQKLLQ